MSDPFLKDSEVERLTGLKRPSAQIRWLRERGWPHEVNATNRPIIARAEMERRLTGLARRRIPEPNWSALGK